MLAGRLHAVVARFALRGDGTVIHARALPRNGGVAIVAGIGACDVARGFARGDAAVMAAAALRRCTFEDTFHMAGFARDAHMLAAQWKACAEVIKGRAGGGRMGKTEIS